MKQLDFSFQEINMYNKFIHGYLNKEEKYKKLIHFFPEWKNIEESIQHTNISEQLRDSLSESILSDYTSYGIDSQKVLTSINLLKDSNTYTVTTGHQLNLFTGPAYFVYKIVHTLQLAKELSLKFPDNKFIPIYWMASEDHDFEEIQFFNWTNDQKIIWNNENTRGAVGEIEIDQKVLNALEQLTKNDFSSDSSIQQYIDCYKNSNTLAEAHFKLVHKLFESTDLLILDANKAKLKGHFSSTIKKDIEGCFFNDYKDSIEQIRKDEFGIREQAHVREINHFYKTKDSRVRIEKINATTYSTIDKTTTWSKEELFKEIDKSPEKFSPNVILRPLFQQTILPNIAYIGGAAEINYWMQLKGMFELDNRKMPILLVRSSFLMYPKNKYDKLVKKNIGLKEILKKSALKDLIKQFDPNAQLQHELEVQMKDSFNKWMDNLIPDNSFDYSKDAAKRKLDKAVSYMIRKRTKYVKHNLSNEKIAIENAEKIIFPNSIFQERYVNFIALNSITNIDISKLTISDTLNSKCSVCLYSSNKGDLK